MNHNVFNLISSKQVKKKVRIQERTFNFGLHYLSLIKFAVPIYWVLLKNEREAFLVDCY